MDQLNIEKRRIACVTGATAVIGKKIVSELKIKDLHIRILTRKNYQKFSGVEVFEGQLENRILLDRFLSNADYLFHCAGETKDQIGRASCRERV